MLEAKDLELISDIMIKALESTNQKLSALDLSVRDVKLTLENEIKPQIQIVAEGHLDLNRKLDNSLQKMLEVQNEKEILNLRLVYLESEIKRIQARLSELETA